MRKSAKKAYQGLSLNNKMFALATIGSSFNFPRFPVVSNGFPAFTNGRVFSRTSLWFHVFLCGLSAVSCFPAFTDGFVFSFGILYLNFCYIYRAIPIIVLAYFRAGIAVNFTLFRVNLFFFPSAGDNSPSGPSPGTVFD